MSRFRKWFKDQYGRVPNERLRQSLRIKHDNALAAALDLERELELEERLARQFNDALLGWNAGNSAAKERDDRQRTLGLA